MRRNPIRIGRLLLLLGGAGLAGAAEPPPPHAAVVPIRHFAFQAMDVVVAAGGTVTWTNEDSEPHTVVATGGAFRSPPLDQGESFSFRFEHPGTYPYVCTIHPQMHASVTVR